LVGVGPKEPLDETHLDTAKDVIDEHVIVGLFEEIPETIKRYEEFLGWYVGETIPEIFACHKQTYDEFSLGYSVTGNYGSGDAVGFNTIVASHRMDIIIYRYAMEVFDRQGATFAAKEQQLHDGTVADHRADEKAEAEKEGIPIIAEAVQNAV